jgi:sortase A
MRRVLSISGWTMVWSGLGLLGFVAFQLYGTDLLNARHQAEAAETIEVVLDERRDTMPAPEPPPTTVAGEPVEELPVLLQEPELDEGEPLGRIRIPAIGVDQVLFEGVSTETLKLGPGHMPWTVHPGQPGNAVISGHRVTHGRPFYDLDRLIDGDVIEVETATGTHRYTVRDRAVVLPTDVWVTDPRRGAWLTLTTCNPKHSARERLIVFAELTEGPNLDYIDYLVLTGIDEAA